MKNPRLFDVIELLIDIPEKNLKKGEQGSIIEDYQDGVYEVEFCNRNGETIALCPISHDKFTVVWSSETKQWLTTFSV